LSKFKIEIEVDTDKKEIEITDDAGNKKVLQSIIVTGGDAESKTFYLFGWGSSSDAGWALATGFKSTNDPFYKRVFSHFSEWIATYMGFKKAGNAIDSPEVLRAIEKWEKEDKAKEGKKDLKDWN
jgi:hypothetical protein